MEIEGDFCSYGVDVIVDRVLSGQYPLVYLALPLRHRCVCGKPHTPTCLTEHHQRGIQLLAVDTCVGPALRALQLSERRKLRIDAELITLLKAIDNYQRLNEWYPPLAGCLWLTCSDNLCAVFNNYVQHGVSSALVSKSTFQKLADTGLVMSVPTHYTIPDHRTPWLQKKVQPKSNYTCYIISIASRCMERRLPRELVYIIADYLVSKPELC